MKRSILFMLVLSAATAAACGDSASKSGQEVIIVDDDASGSSPDAGNNGGSANNGGGGDVGSPDMGADMSEGVPGHPVLGDGAHSLDAVELTTIGSSAEGLARPTDLAFNPESTDQLWVVNQDDSSVVIFFEPGTSNQTDERFAGGNNTHFLAKPASLAFGAPGTMATAQQEDEQTQPSTPEDFMGPTLWSTDLAVFDAGHGGHLDMLHNSPLSSGIAWDEGNAYWIFDGYHDAITHYNFHGDHGPGGADHSDGVVHRWVEGEVADADGTVAHLDMDHDTDLLYIADSGNGRIAVLDPSTGSEGDAILPNYDGTTQIRMTGGELSTLVDGSAVGLQTPAGLELHDDHLFVTDNATSTIWAFDLEGNVVDHLDVSEEVPTGGLSGIAFDDEGRLHLVDSSGSRVLRIAASQ